MITNESFLENLKTFFEEEDSLKLTIDTQFSTLKTWDSLTQFSIVAYLEDDFGIEMPVEQFVKFQSPRELLEFVKSSANK